MKGQFWGCRLIVFVFVFFPKAFIIFFIIDMSKSFVDVLLENCKNFNATWNKFRTRWFFSSIYWLVLVPLYSNNLLSLFSQMLKHFLSKLLFLFLFLLCNIIFSFVFYIFSDWLSLNQFSQFFEITWKYFKLAACLLL